jgi:hypothetical protein
VTLPFQQLMLCWAVVWPQLEFLFCPVLGTKCWEECQQNGDPDVHGLVNHVMWGAAEESMAIKLHMRFLGMISVARWVLNHQAKVGGYSLML